MESEINSKEYWDQRFDTGHWERCHGRPQTSAFAEEQARRLQLPADFGGSVLDFGCGLGDAFPIYRARFPRCQLVGVDHSEVAIARCREEFGHLATFIAGGVDDVPEADVIIASNVLEHIADHDSAVRALLARCSELYVFVPYEEDPLTSEHVNRYDRNSFASFAKLETEVFSSRGWSEYGRALWVDVYLRNLLRALRGKPLVKRNRQVMYRLQGDRRSSQWTATREG